jgi:hypothetical protein
MTKRNYYKILLEEGKLEEFTDRMINMGNIAHAAAAWGFAGEGFMLEKGAEVILEQEKRIKELEEKLDYLYSIDPR